MSNKTTDLVEYMQEWIKAKQDSKFWDTAKRVNLSILLAPITERQHNEIVHNIVVLVKLAQMAAFRDGLEHGRWEERQLSEKRFSFVKQEASDIAYIIQRNQNNIRFLKELRAFAIGFESSYYKTKGSGKN